MKKLLLNIILLTGSVICSHLLSAQTYIPIAKDSCRWAGNKVCQNGMGGGPVNYYYGYNTNGDTIINSKTYYKVYGGNSISFIREDSNRTYIRYPYSTYHDSTDMLMYDFNLKINDSFFAKCDSFGSLVNFKAKVLKVDSVQTNTGYRKRITIQPDQQTPSIAYFYSLNWIEGIGNDLNPFYFEIPYDFFFECNTSLTCFTEKNISIFGSGSCYAGINDEEVENDFTLYPNPSSGLTTIHFNSFITGSAELSILNVSGQVLYSVNIRDVSIQKTYDLDLTNYTKGVYFIQKKSQENNSYHKLIIQ